MKRTEIASDDRDSAAQPRAAKRVKASKACRTCRQQKTRCDVNDGSEVLGRCKRCIHFGLDCSFERSPPKSTTSLPPTGSSMHSGVPWAPSPEAHEGPSGSPTISTANREGGSSSNAKSTLEMDDPSKKHVSGWSHNNCPDPFYNPPRYPLAPPSPPRTIDKLPDRRYAYEMVVTTNFYQQSQRPSSEQWTGPLTFTNNLIARTPAEQVGSSRLSLAAQGIVTEAEARALERIWNDRYVPWMTEYLAKDVSRPSAFLQAARYLVAARHIVSASSSFSVPLTTRLSQFIDRSVTRVAIGLDTSVSSARALLVLGLWTSAMDASESPLSQTTAQPRNFLQAQHTGVAIDGDMFLRTAMMLACKMHLEADVEVAVNHAQARNDEANGKPATKIPSGPGGRLDPSKPLSEEQLDRVRLMFQVDVLVAYNAATKGSLCSTRVPLHYAEQIFGRASLLATRGATSDSCLVYKCNLVEVTLRMVELTSGSGVMQDMGLFAWSNRMKEDFKLLEHIQQSIQTSIALAEPEDMMAFSVVAGQAQFIRLFMLARAFKGVFRSFPRLRPGMPTAIAAAITGNSKALHPLEPFRTVMEPTFGNANASNARGVTEGGPFKPLSPRSVSAELKEFPDITGRVEELALEWARSGKESSETMLVTWLGLKGLNRGAFTLPSEAEVDADGEPIKEDKRLGIMAYCPDAVLSQLMFAPVYMIKIQLMAMQVFQVETPRQELTRGLLSRILNMLREVSPPPSSTPSSAPVSKTKPPHPPPDEGHANPRYPTASTPAPHTGVTPPPLPSSTLVGRAADVLGALIRLLDVRTADFRVAAAAKAAREASKGKEGEEVDMRNADPATKMNFLGLSATNTNSTLPTPPGSSSTSHPTPPDGDQSAEPVCWPAPDKDSSRGDKAVGNGGPSVSEENPDWTSEQGLHTLASSLSTFKELGAMQSPSRNSNGSVPPPSTQQGSSDPSSSTAPAPAAAPGFEASALLGGAMPPYPAAMGQPHQQQGGAVHMPMPAYTGEQGELFGTGFGFDLASYWDTSFLYNLEGGQDGF